MGFREPTETQVRAIPRIMAGKNLLLMAPTGTGKTEAALLPILDRLLEIKGRLSGIALLYITPLRALNRDLLDRIQGWCVELDLRLGVRHGDTELRDRARQALAPPHILITTPETLQAILPARLMRGHLRSVRWTIVDEVHELADNKRGSQLAVALERLRRLAHQGIQLVGLSATIGSPELVGKMLVGIREEVEIVKVPVPRPMRISLVYPSPSREDEELASKLNTFPEVASRLRVLREAIDGHRSTLLFTNTRSESEALINRFRIWDQDYPIAVHHGSLSKPTRISAEGRLKAGELRALVCTSSLEMGIDIGYLDMVLQYNSPRQVTRLIQRVGRSGHRIGETAEGLIVTQDSDDALEAMVIARRALVEMLEPVEPPEGPMDVLLHQLAGLLLERSRWYLEDALELLRCTYPFRELDEVKLREVLEYAHNRYPRLIWFSSKEGYFTRPQALSELYGYYFNNLSMIPEERQYLVLADDGSPIGVLDEAFVSEHGDVGTKFVEAGCVWRIEQVLEDRIHVRREEDPTGAIPTWVGEEIPVPYEVAQEVGRIRGIAFEALAKGDSLSQIADRLSKEYPAEKETIEKALKETWEQYSLGLPIPTDRTITLEKWGEYLIANCCFGTLINRALARILGHLASEKTGRATLVHQDPYRLIIQNSELNLEAFKELLLSLEPVGLDSIALEAFVKTGAFKRRFLHVARKMGVLGPEADVSSVKLSSLIESFRDTVVYKEALRTMLELDADLEGSKRVLEELKEGRLRVKVLGEVKEPSPISRIALEELTRRTDIIPPDRLRAVLVSSARARLLNEGLTVFCTHCWDYIEAMPVKRIGETSKCPLCNDRGLGMLKEPEERLRALAEQTHRGIKELPSRYKRLGSQATKSSTLFKKYGLLFPIVLAGRGIRLSDAEEILKRHTSPSDRLFEDILRSERMALKRGFSLR